MFLGRHAQDRAEEEAVRLAKQEGRGKRPRHDPKRPPPRPQIFTTTLTALNTILSAPDTVKNRDNVQNSLSSKDPT